MHYSRREFIKASALAGCLITTGEGLPYALAGEDDTDAALQPESPFLQGNFAPVREEITIDRLRVIGEIPRELDGMYLRNGPNPQFPPRGAYHWFDGDGMLHGVRFGEGQASYRNRYVQTAGWNEERAAGKSLWTGLAEPPDLKMLSAGKPLFKNAANTALVWHDGRLLALWEGGEPYAVRVPDLTTAGPYDYSGTLHHPFTAHPKVDAATGEMMFFGYSALTPMVQYSLVDAQGQLTSTVGIKLPRPVMMHDFAVTERYSVFLDLPAAFDFSRMLRGEPLFGYDPQYGARFGIVPRHGRGDEVRWFDVEPCFVFHTLNAYDDEDSVVVLGCRMAEYPRSVDLRASTDSSSPLTDTPSVLYQWRFDLASGTTQEGPLDDVPADLPRVPDAYVGRHSRYGYLMSLEMGGLIKYDFVRNTSSIHSHGLGRLGGEGTFVPRPGARTEDDGWVVTYVFDAATGTSEAVVLDAQNFDSPPLARALIPVRVPFGFHGIWLDRARLEA